MARDRTKLLTAPEAAVMLDLGVNAVRAAVDRGQLLAVRTPGGHRRILRSSVDAWLAGHLIRESSPTAAQVALALAALPDPTLSWPCSLCPDDVDFGSSDTHHPKCPWRMAREWASKAAPASS